DQYLCKRGIEKGMFKMDHPSFPFDKCYFASQSPVKKWSEEDYLIADARYSPHQPSLSLFTPKMIQPPIQEECSVDIRLLKKLARNPLKFYFHETLKIYLRDEEDEEKDEFLISNLQKYALRKKALHLPIEQVLKASCAQGKLPRGLFQDAATEGFEEEIEDSLKALKGLGVSVDEIFSKRLCVEEGLSLAIKLSDCRIVHIVGELEDLTPKGLLANISGDLPGLISVWPLYLVYRCLDPKNRLLLLVKKGKEMEIAVEDPSAALASYLEYFFFAKRQPSPLLPEWAKTLLQGNEEDFSAVMVKDLNEPYLNYLKRRQSPFDPAETFSLWQPLLKKTFSCLVGGENAL